MRVKSRPSISQLDLFAPVIEPATTMPPVTITVPASLPPINTVALAREFYAYIKRGNDFASKRELQKYVAQFLDVELSMIMEAISRLVIDPRALDEAYEYAQVLYARDLAGNTTIPHEDKLPQFLNRYERQLNISQRDTTVKQHQQYSTPLPLCYLLGRYLRLSEEGRYYEPTAGNGALVILAKPQQVIVNELDSGPRLAALHDQGFAQVFNEDALTLPRNHPELARQMDAVIANPPFATMAEVVQYHGYRITKLEHLIALRSLELMKDDGRAAIIIGGHNFHDNYGRERPELHVCDQVFFNYLYGHYHVVKNIDVDGEIYKRQGTTFPVRVLLIEGRKAQPVDGYAAPRSQKEIERASTWETLNRLLEPPAHDGQPDHQEIVVNEPAHRANEYQMPYVPVSQHPGAVEYLSPKNLTEPQRTALEQIKRRHGTLALVDRTHLDLALAIALLVMSAWRGVIDGPIHVVHDKSSNMRRQENIWEKLMDPNLAKVNPGYDHRRLNFPIAATTEFASSSDWAGLQLADILAGAINVSTMANFGFCQQSPYTEEIREVMHDLPIFYQIVPEPKVTPAELGIEEDETDGDDPVEYLSQFF